MGRSEYLPANDGGLARVSGGWAREKLYYVSRYMHVFSLAMKQKWSQRLYFDLMAGPGLCITDDGRDTFDGSPLLAAKTAPPFTSVIAVEEHPDLVSALGARLAPFPHARIVRGDCNNCGVIEELRGEAAKPDTLALAFLDMLGTDVAFSTIQALTRGARIDLLITFQVNDLCRNATMALEGQQRRRFDTFFGTSDWARIVAMEQRANRSPGQTASALTEFYAERLGAIGYPCVQPLHRLMKTTTDAPLYRLILASKHPRGAELFTKITKVEASGQRGLF
jgi:three-Cys-motif partner protein